MTQLENHVLKTAVDKIKAVREVLGWLYIPTFNFKECEISPALKEELSEQHRRLITLQSKLSTVEKNYRISN